MLRIFLFFCLLKNLNATEVLDNATKKYRKKLEIEKKIKKYKKKLVYWGLGFVFFHSICVMVNHFMPSSFLAIKVLILIFFSTAGFICELMCLKFLWFIAQKETKIELLMENDNE